MKYNSVFYEDCDVIYQAIPNVKMLNNKVIVVTGSTGLIGSAIIDFLSYLNEKRGFNTVIYAGCRSSDKFRDRFKDRSGLGIRYFTYDALKELTIDFEPDYVINAASLANPNAYVTKPVETMLTNFIGTNEWLKNLSHTSKGRFLLVSSSEVYGQKDSSDLYQENEYGYVDILNPRACYPSSKRATETLCASYKKEYGCDYVVVRPGHIYGPSYTKEDNRASTAFIRDVVSGSDIVMKSNGLNLRSYCYSFDAVSAILCVLINGENGIAYNISSLKSIATIREFAESLAKVSGKKVVFENPTDQEIQSYNLMENSALKAELLELLGWDGVFDLKTGITHTLKMLTE